MKPYIRAAMAVAALALAAVPAMAAANPPSQVPPENPGTAHHQGNLPQGPNYSPEPLTPGPKASLPEKAKAYGVYCRGKSKKHEQGEKGTEFSRCVTAMAKAATHPNMPPGRACKGEGKKHEAGKPGTPFSRCVTAVGKLRQQERQEGEG